jgi:Flp pilus assembly CpaE family ATPase
VNRGNPAVVAEPKAEFSKAIRAMAKELVAAQAVAKQKKKFMATLAKA